MKDKINEPIHYSTRADRGHRVIRLPARHRAWAEIDTGALRRNYMRLRGRFAPAGSGRRVICVVKADAYGHGAGICVPALCEAGADYFAVSCIDEALTLRGILRDKTVKPDADILILGRTPPEFAPLLTENNITQTVFSSEYARALSAATSPDNPINIHIKLDTGMNRLGFVCGDGDGVSVENRYGGASGCAAEAAAVCLLPGLHPAGIFSHASRADEIGCGGDGFGVTRRQFDRFTETASEIERLSGIKFAQKHFCNSAAAAAHGYARLDCVRLGIILFGLTPSLTPYEWALGIEPVMRLYARISQVRTLAAGEAVSYGGVYTAPSDRLLATVSIGYADGFLRAFGGCRMLVRGKYAPVIGRICMDMCMLDVTETGAEPGEEVCVFGVHPEQITRLAESAGTICYEITCQISSRIGRIEIRS